MIGRIFAATAGLCLLAAAFSSAEAEPRVALVIGNANYGAQMGRLPNPVNDANLIAKSLQQTGFTVIKVTDADQKKMKRAIADFGEKLANAGPQATGLFYYAGHGVQTQGQNFLIPVGAAIDREVDVDIESVSADDVIKQMDFAANAVNIIILDACRNNPIARSMRSATRGLAPMQSDSVRGTFIAYSTAPGKTAADGTGKNSPYSQALASAIVQPGVGIEEMFRDVRGKVMQETNNQQIPWDSSSLTAPFFFKPTSAQFTTAAQPAPAIAPQPAVAPASTQTKPSVQPAAPVVQQPAAAPVESEVSTASEPVAEPASTRAAKPGIELDSHGVDCRIMDSTRSDSDCKNTRRFGPANKAGGYGGSKSSGSHGWN